MFRLRSLAAALLCLACIGAVVRVGMWWVVTSVASTQPIATAGPRLQLVTDHYDLGRVFAGDSPTVRFVIANSGSRPLAVRPAPQQCCGGKLPPATTVEPGQTTELAVDVAWRELASHERQEFHFLTNDPARPEFRLIVRGTVQQRRPEEHSVLVRKMTEEPKNQRTK